MSITVHYALKKKTETGKLVMSNHYQTQSTITCSSCGHSECETMPLDACVYLYECRSCKNLMTPQSGDCCVFCSRGTQPCPTSQREGKSYRRIARQTELESINYGSSSYLAG